MALMKELIEPHLGELNHYLASGQQSVLGTKTDTTHQGRRDWSTAGAKNRG
jgi:hypothetical protein